MITSHKTMPLSSDACAKGTRTNHADGAIRKYAPRTFTGSSLVNPMTASARNARAADPTDGRGVVEIHRARIGQADLVGLLARL